jgi:hypothetical protein
MRISSKAVAVLGLAVASNSFTGHHPLLSVSAFAPTVRPNFYAMTRSTRQIHSALFATADNEDDCGCGPSTIFSGKPSDAAKRVNPRQAIKQATASIYDVNGKSVLLEDLLMTRNDDQKVNIVVFLRSLG